MILPERGRYGGNAQRSLKFFSLQLDLWMTGTRRVQRTLGWWLSARGRSGTPAPWNAGRRWNLG